MRWIFGMGEFLLSFGEVYLCYEIMGRIFQNRVSRVKQRALYGVCSLLFGAMIAFNRSITLFSNALLVLMLICLTVTGKYLYEIKLPELWITCGIYNVCIGLLDIFGAFIVTLITRNPAWGQFLSLNYSPWRILILVCTRGLFLLFFLKFGHKMGEWRYQIRRYQKILLGFLMLGLGGILYFQKVFVDVVTVKFLMIGFLYFMSFQMLCCIFGFWAMYHAAAERARIIHIRNELLEANLKEIGNLYSESGRTFHDMKNHIHVLYELAKKNETESIMKYIESIQKPILDLNQMVWSGNQIIDLVLNYKQKEARKRGMDIQIEADPLDEIHVEDSDLCSIFANLLDNAIDACEYVEKEKRKIQVTIRKKNSMLLIGIENTYKIEPVEQYGVLKTTKPDKKIHGFGMESVRKAVEKNNGFLEYQFQKHIFRVNITLFCCD